LRDASTTTSAAGVVVVRNTRMRFGAVRDVGGAGATCRLVTAEVAELSV